ncbi:DUF3416 domain-containing protein, partial [candidate division GN15 bacterium]|nr:DUF3416 domain-containing protein [candidate division GN15 bacterium]
MNDSNDQGTRRVIIENLQPSVDNGAFPAKRVVGETVKVQADIFADGHDRVVAEMLYRKESETDWRTVPMQFLGNDRWQASFTIDEMVPYRFTVRGWIDRFLTWQSDLEKKYDAGQDLEVELQIGALFIDAAVNRVPEKTAERLRELAAILRIKGQIEDAVDVALGEELSEVMAAYPDTTRATQFHRESVISVDPPKALFSTWYELFPRSTGPDVVTHGTFKDVMKRLPDIAEMGFDVLYLPPIHPIGKANRKGKNNSPISEPGEPGSPWAIGSDEGG